MRRIALLLSIIALGMSALPLQAQVKLGSLPPNASRYIPGGVRTMVDMNPAPLSGTVDTLTVRWRSFGACTGAFKIKVLRPTTFPNYITIAERGPFDPSGDGFLTFPIAPIEIGPGDLLATVATKPSSGCGAVYSAEDVAYSYMIISGDLPSTGALTGSIIPASAVGARLSSSSTATAAGYVPVAGSAAGANNSFFRTALQLSNRDDAVISGRLVFHPAGKSAAATDPTLAYSIAPNSTVHYADVVSNFGTSGLGSIDVIPTNTPIPLITARVFNDLGSGGTLGFSFNPVDAKDLLTVSDVAFLTVPADLTNFRMNVGILTLGEGVTFTTFALDTNGAAVVGSRTRSYPANYFEQIPLDTFLQGTAKANGRVQIYVTAGSVFIYGTTTDNRTNDSTISFARQ